MSEGPPSAIDPWERLRSLYGTGAHDALLGLERHLELGDGFAFIPVFLPEIHASDLARDGLKQRLARQGQQVWEVPLTSPSDVSHLPVRLQRDVPPEDCGAAWVAACVPTTESTTPEWRAAWVDALRRLNERRDVVRTRLHFPLVIVGLPWLKTIWQNEAPDFWSVRTLVVEATPHGKPEAPWLATKIGPIGWELTRWMTLGLDYWIQDPDRAVEQARRLARSPAMVPQAVALLLQASHWMSSHDQATQAVELAREADGLARRELEAHPANHDLLGARVGVLLVLGDRLRATQQMDEAFRVLQQAVAMAADLARQDPGRFTGLAAQSFALWAALLWFMGRYAEGATAASQSVRYWRNVPSRSAAQLAEVLLLESFCRVGASDLSGGERAARHAVEILHAEGNAAPKLTLAKALELHGRTLGHMGQHESALIRLREAIRWIQAAGDLRADPDGIALLVTCHGDLATSLLLSGRLQEAIAQATEGVAVARDASVVHGDRIRHVLAAALGKWVACLGAAGRQGEAWAHALEAVELRRAMARQDGSVAQREMLALALRMLAKCEEDLGLPGAALARLREALHWRNPDLGHPSSTPPPLDRITADYLGLLRQLGREPDPSGPEAFLAPWLGGRRA